MDVAYCQTWYTSSLFNMLRAHLKFQTLYALEVCAYHDLEQIQVNSPKLHKHLSSTHPPAFHGSWVGLCTRSRYGVDELFISQIDGVDIVVPVLWISTERFFTAPENAIYVWLSIVCSSRLRHKGSRAINFALNHLRVYHTFNCKEKRWMCISIVKYVLPYDNTATKATATLMKFSYAQAADRMGIS